MPLTPETDENLRRAFAPYYLGVASAIEKAGELAAGVEAWLVGSVPSGVVEDADRYDSAVRLLLTSVEFGSSDEKDVNRLFQVSAALRSAYRGAYETTRLLSLLDPAPEVRACFAMGGDGLATQARLAPHPNGPFTKEVALDNRRRAAYSIQASRNAILGIRRETMPGGVFTTKRIQRAGLLSLIVASESFQRAMELLCRLEAVP